MSPFSWQGENLCRLTLAFITDWRAVRVAAAGISTEIEGPHTEVFPYVVVALLGYAQMDGCTRMQLFSWSLLGRPINKSWLQFALLGEENITLFTE